MTLLNQLDLLRIMNWRLNSRRRLLPTLLGLSLVVASQSANAIATVLPTGQLLTPMAAPGANLEVLDPHLTDRPDIRAGHAMTARLSPDGRTLLVLTSGFNTVADATGKSIVADTGEWVFVFDVNGAAARQIQQIRVDDAFVGLAWAGDGEHFYVSGGGGGSVRSYVRRDGAWTADGEPIALNLPNGNGLGTIKPTVAGVAVNADGTRLVTANVENDSLSLVDLSARRVIGTLDLRPGRIDPRQHGKPGGEYPYWVVVQGNGTAYVSSLRDREVDVVDIRTTPKLIARIPVRGNPNKMILDRRQQRLFVAEDNSDSVSVIDTRTRRVAHTLHVSAPVGLMAKKRRYRGAAPNGLVLSPDERRLYVTEGGSNALAVVALDRPGMPVLGLIPTGWYPNDVAVSADGQQLFVINGKSQAGPNPHNCYGYGAHCRPDSPVHYAPNEYVLQLSTAGFLSLPVPDAQTLRRLSHQVAVNNGFDAQTDQHDAELMAELHHRIHHVIYVVRENRTYDQILGDLPVGNGDPQLVEFGAAVTPNQHRLASDFVTLDNFYDAGEVSGNGWMWSTAARETDWNVHSIPVNYAERGLSYDAEGPNRHINVGLEQVPRIAANPATPTDPDLLPGTGNVDATDGPDGEIQQGYLWNAALRAGKSIRNYGFYCDLSRYQPDRLNSIPLEHDPHAKNLTVAYPANPALVGRTDPYFRGYDNLFPDYYRYQEWKREFDAYAANGKLPDLSLVRFMHDHTGKFGRAIDGVNTPETQVADNDYAVGLLVEAVAKSRYANDTLIFVIEDDAQDGPDHVDAQRSVAFVAGPYVRQHALVSAHYSTVNMLRTIEDVLGIDHLSLNDAYQHPMSEVFDLAQRDWQFKATPSPFLVSTQLPVQQPVAALVRQPTHDAAWWEAQMADMDFSVEDHLDVARYNQILWNGLRGNQPYPLRRSGADLRSGRNSLLAVGADQ